MTEPYVHGVTGTTLRPKTQRFVLDTPKAPTVRNASQLKSNTDMIARYNQRRESSVRREEQSKPKGALWKRIATPVAKGVGKVLEYTSGSELAYKIPGIGENLEAAADYIPGVRTALAVATNPLTYATGGAAGGLAAAAGAGLGTFALSDRDRGLGLDLPGVSEKYEEAVGGAVGGLAGGMGMRAIKVRNARAAAKSAEENIRRIEGGTLQPDDVLHTPDNVRFFPRRPTADAPDNPLDWHSYSVKNTKNFKYDPDELQWVRNVDEAAAAVTGNRALGSAERLASTLGDDATLISEGVKAASRGKNIFQKIGDVAQETVMPPGFKHIRRLDRGIGQAVGKLAPAPLEPVVSALARPSVMLGAGVLMNPGEAKDVIKKVFEVDKKIGLAIARKTLPKTDWDLGIKGLHNVNVEGVGAEIFRPTNFINFSPAGMGLKAGMKVVSIAAAKQLGKRAILEGAGNAGLMGLEVYTMGGDVEAIAQGMLMGFGAGAVLPVGMDVAGHHLKPIIAKVRSAASPEEAAAAAADLADDAAKAFEEAPDDAMVAPEADMVAPDADRLAAQASAEPLNTGTALQQALDDQNSSLNRALEEAGATRPNTGDTNVDAAVEQWLAGGVSRGSLDLEQAFSRGMDDPLAQAVYRHFEPVRVALREIYPEGRVPLYHSSVESARPSTLVSAGDERIARAFMENSENRVLRKADVGIDDIVAASDGTLGGMRLEAPDGGDAPYNDFITLRRAFEPERAIEQTPPVIPGRPTGALDAGDIGPQGAAPTGAKPDLQPFIDLPRRAQASVEPVGEGWTSKTFDGVARRQVDSSQYGRVFEREDGSFDFVDSRWADIKTGETGGTSGHIRNFPTYEMARQELEDLTARFTTSPEAREAAFKEDAARAIEDADATREAEQLMRPDVLRQAENVAARADQPRVIDAAPSRLTPVIEQTMQQGGATFDIRTGQFVPYQGNFVGGLAPTVKIPADEITTADLDAFVRDNFDSAFSKSDVHLGTEVVEENGKRIVNLDAVEVVADEADALGRAAARGEERIWSADKDTAIETPGVKQTQRNLRAQADTAPLTPRLAPLEFEQTPELLQRVASDTLNNGGASYDINTGQTLDKSLPGSMIGDPDHTVIIPRADFERSGQYFIKNFIRQNRELLEQDDAYLGTWIDDSGDIQIDVSNRVTEKPNIEAATRGKIARYDIQRGKRVNIPKDVRARTPVREPVQRAYGDLEAPQDVAGRPGVKREPLPVEEGSPADLAARAEAARMERETADAIRVTGEKPDFTQARPAAEKPFKDSSYKLEDKTSDPDGRYKGYLQGMPRVYMTIKNAALHLTNQKAINAWRKDLMMKVKNGIAARFWYEDSTAEMLRQLDIEVDTRNPNAVQEASKQILEHFGGDVARADAFTQAIAITSVQTPVAENARQALASYYKFLTNTPAFDLKTDVTHDKLWKAATGVDWGSRKTNRFYFAHLKFINPEKYERLAKAGATIDVWMARAMGLTQRSATAYRRVTAAPGDKALKPSGKVGYLTTTKPSKATIGNFEVMHDVEVPSYSPTELQYANMAREIALIRENLNAELGPDDVKWTDDQVQAAIWTTEKMIQEGTAAIEAGADYSTMMQKHRAEMEIAVLSDNSRLLEMYPELKNATEEQLTDVIAIVRNIMSDDFGKNSIIRTFGVLGQRETPFTDVAGRPALSREASAPLGPGSVARPLVSDEAVQVMNGAVAFNADLWGLPQSGWVRPIRGVAPVLNNAMEIAPGKLTTEQVIALDAALGDAATVVTTPFGVHVINNDPELNAFTFHKVVGDKEQPVGFSPERQAEALAKRKAKDEARRTKKSKGKEQDADEPDVDDPDADEPASRWIVRDAEGNQIKNVAGGPRLTTKYKQLGLTFNKKVQKALADIGAKDANAEPLRVQRGVVTKEQGYDQFILDAGVDTRRIQQLRNRLESRLEQADGRIREVLGAASREVEAPEGTPRGQRAQGNVDESPRAQSSVEPNQPRIIQRITDRPREMLEEVSEYRVNADGTLDERVTTYNTNPRGNSGGQTDQPAYGQKMGDSGWVRDKNANLETLERSGWTEKTDVDPEDLTSKATDAEPDVEIDPEIQKVIDDEAAKLGDMDKPSAKAARASVERLRAKGVSVEGIEDAISDLDGIERADFEPGADGREDFLSAKADEWDNIINAINEADVSPDISRAQSTAEFAEVIRAEEYGHPITDKIGGKKKTYAAGEWGDADSSVSQKALDEGTPIEGTDKNVASLNPAHSDIVSQLSKMPAVAQFVEVSVRAVDRVREAFKRTVFAQEQVDVVYGGHLLDRASGMGSDGNMYVYSLRAQFNTTSGVNGPGSGRAMIQNDVLAQLYEAKLITDGIKKLDPELQEYLVRTVGEGYTEEDMLAAMMGDTMFHEMVHRTILGHEENFNHVLRTFKSQMADDFDAVVADYRQAIEGWKASGELDKLKELSDAATRIDHNKPVSRPEVEPTSVRDATGRDVEAAAGRSGDSRVPESVRGRVGEDVPSGEPVAVGGRAAAGAEPRRVEAEGTVDQPRKRTVTRVGESSRTAGEQEWAAKVSRTEGQARERAVARQNKLDAERGKITERPRYTARLSGDRRRPEWVVMDAETKARADVKPVVVERYPERWDSGDPKPPKSLRDTVDKMNTDGGYPTRNVRAQASGMRRISRPASVAPIKTADDLAFIESYRVASDKVSYKDAGPGKVFMDMKENWDEDRLVQRLSEMDDVIEGNFIDNAMRRMGQKLSNFWGGKRLVETIGGKAGTAKTPWEKAVVGLHIILGEGEARKHTALNWLRGAKNVFEETLDEQGMKSGMVDITDVDGNIVRADLDDVLSNPSQYKLNDAQKAYVDTTHKIIDDLVDEMRANGIDIKELGIEKRGEHYFPRYVKNKGGDWEIAGKAYDAEDANYVKRGLGQKANFQKARQHATIAAGKKKGYIYARPEEALEQFFTQANYSIAGKKFLATLPEVSTTGKALALSENGITVTRFNKKTGKLEQVQVLAPIYAATKELAKAKKGVKQAKRELGAARVGRRDMRTGAGNRKLSMRELTSMANEMDEVKAARKSLAEAKARKAANKAGIDVQSPEDVKLEAAFRRAKDNYDALLKRQNAYGQMRGHTTESPGIPKEQIAAAHQKMVDTRNKLAADNIMRLGSQLNDTVASARAQIRAAHNIGRGANIGISTQAIADAQIRVDIAEAKFDAAKRNSVQTARDMRAIILAKSSAMSAPRSIFGLEGDILPVMPGEVKLGRVNVMGLQGKLFPDNVAKDLNEAFEEVKLTGILDTVGKFNNYARLARTSTDFGYLFIQGLPVLAAHPVAFAKAAHQAVKALFDPEGYARWMQTKHKTIQEMYPFAGAFTGNEYYTATKGGFIKQWADTSGNLQRPDKLARQGAGVTLQRFAVSFDAFLDASKITMWEGMAPHMKTRADKEAYGRLLRNMTGTTDTGRLAMSQKQRSVEGLLMFSPRFTRSIFALAAMAIEPGPARMEAFKSIGIMMAAATVLFAGTKMAMYEAGLSDDPFEWQDLDPSQGARFMSIKVGDNYIGLGGSMRGAAQLMANIGKSLASPERFISTDSTSNDKGNPFLKFARGKLSPFAGTAVDLAVGKTVIGEDVSDRKQWAMRLPDQFLPFAAATIAETEGGIGQKLGGLAATGVGFRQFPESGYEDLDARVRELTKDKTIAGWSSMTSTQKNNLMEKHPELQKMLDKAETQNWTKNRDLTKEYDDKKAALAARWLKTQGESGGEKRTKEDLTSKEYRDQLEALNIGLRAARAERNKGRNSEFGKPKNARQKLMKQYYDEVDYEKFVRPDGSFDYDAKDAAESQFMSALTPEARKIIIEETAGTSTDPLEKKLKEDNTSIAPYWDLRDTVAQKMGFESALEISQQHVRVQKRYDALLTVEQQKWRRKNPELEQNMLVWGRVSTPISEQSIGGGKSKFGLKKKRKVRRTR